MSLDFDKVALQVKGMITRLAAGSMERQEHLKRAQATLNENADNLENLQKKIIASNTTWLVARLVEGPANRYTVPPLPVEFNVVATDGSYIDVERNK